MTRPHSEDDRPPETIALRAADVEDVEFLWLVRNDPDVRRISRRRQELRLEDYRREVMAGLSDPDQEWLIVEAGGENAGYVKIARRTNDTYEIGIGIDARFRGRGVGARSIQLATSAFRARHPHAPLVALVRPENRASSLAFERARYVRAGHDGPFLVYIAGEAD